MLLEQFVAVLCMHFFGHAQRKVIHAMVRLFEIIEINSARNDRDLRKLTRNNEKRSNLPYTENFGYKRIVVVIISFLILVYNRNFMPNLSLVLMHQQARVEITSRITVRLIILFPTMLWHLSIDRVVQNHLGAI